MNLTFKVAFKYPFNRAKGMWDILWILLPFLGGFILTGYTIRVVQEFSKGKFKELPIFDMDKDLTLGFIMWLKSLPFMILYFIIIMGLTAIHPWARFVSLPFDIFALPILFIHFMNKETVNSLFEFKVIKHVFNNFGDYLVTLLKSIALGLIFLVMIIVLVGFPAGSFTKNIFLTDFYRRRVLKLK